MQIATGDRIHGGHRERMRSKFKIHGDRVFDTYELLEMLLYYVIPYKDTNPIAKGLLLRFSSLEGISSATKEELMSVDGIGERAAEFLIGASRSYRDIIMEESTYCFEEVQTQEKAGELFVRYFSSFTTPKERGQKRVVMALLNSEMQLISLAEIYKMDFESGAIRSKPFIEAALAANAAVVMLAHNHTYGPACPSPSDRETNKMIRDDLMNADIDLVEHFVIVGREYVGFSRPTVSSVLKQTASLDNFIKDCALYTEARQIDSLPELLNEKENKLRDLISLIEKDEDARSVSASVSRCFMRLADVFTSDLYVLEECSSKRTALFLKLFFALAIRLRTDRFEFGRAHTQEEIAEYLTARIGYEPRECVYVMLFDEKERALACEFVSEGTVNSSSVSPRKLLEIAKRHGAAGMIIVHNHPGGAPLPSQYDISTTISVARLLGTVGVRFIAHYIISGRKYFVISDLGNGEMKIGTDIRECPLK